MGTEVNAYWNGFEWGARTYVMGILNVTPDSFYDGGRHDCLDAAIAQARQMRDEGADILDIGAESTRPGAAPVDAATELARLRPVVEALLAEPDLPPLSVDTAKAAVADEILGLGVTILNDINGLLGDPQMASVAARRHASIVAMHNGRISPIQGEAVASVMEYFQTMLQTATAAGLPREALVLDPGVGFGKTAGQSLALMRGLAQMRSSGCPLLLGASRKSVIGHVLDLEVHDRLEGTLATTVAAIARGVDIVRVHDVQANVRAARMADALFRP